MSDGKDRPDFLSLTDSLIKRAISARGDAYLRFVRALQGLAAVDPQNEKIPDVAALAALFPIISMLDAGRAPFRKNGTGFICGKNLVATAARLGTWELANISNNPLSLMVVDRVEYQSAAAGLIGVSAGNLALTKQQAPAALERATEVAGGATSRVKDAEADFEADSTTAASGFSFGTNFQDLPALAATSLPYVMDNLDLVLFPGEQLLVQIQTLNIAGFASFRYRRWQFGNGGSLAGGGA